MPRRIRNTGPQLKFDSSADVREAAGSAWCTSAVMVCVLCAECTGVTFCATYTPAACTAVSAAHCRHRHRRRRLTPARAAPVSARVPGAVCGGVLGAAAPVPPAAVPLGPAAAVRMPDTGDGAVHDHGGVAARLLAVWLLYCQLFVVCLMLVWCVFGVCVHVPVLGVGVRRRLRCRRADVPFPPSLHVCVPAVPRRRFSRPPA